MRKQRDMLEDFSAFNDANPEVLTELTKLALKLKKRGRQRYGIGSLFEVLRWHRVVDGDETFMINNNHRAFYARLIMEKTPQLNDFFKVRRRDLEGA